MKLEEWLPTWNNPRFLTTNQRKEPPDAIRHETEEKGKKRIRGDYWQTRIGRISWRSVAQGEARLGCLDAGFLGRMLAETIMYVEREEISGPEYYPHLPGVKKWASQKGSIYLGDQKVRVDRPRLRGPQGEMDLKSYRCMKGKGAFSEELLARTLRGISLRSYEETVMDALNAFGVSPSAASRRIVEATTGQLRAFKERDLSKTNVFAAFLDTVHRGGEAFVVCLGIDVEGGCQLSP